MQTEREYLSQLAAASCWLTLVVFSVILMTWRKSLALQTP